MNLQLLSKETVHLIIDIQNDFCSPTGLNAQKGRSLSNIQAMLPKMQVFTEKLRELKVLTIFTKLLSSNEISPENMKMHWIVQQGKFDPLCVPGSEGAEFCLLQPRATDVIVEKHYYDAFADTNLKQILIEKGIKNIVITGVRTEICVDNTAKRAFSEGFNVIVIEDLVATNDNKIKDHRIVLSNLSKYSALVMHSDSLLNISKQ